MNLLLSLLLASFAQNLSQIQKVFTSSNSYPARAVAFSPDGSLLAVALSDHSIRILETDSGREADTLIGHTGMVQTVAFSPDGSLLASGSDDKTVKIWKVADFSLLHSLEKHASSVYSVAFSPDGSLLASGSNDKTVKIWKVTDFSFYHSLEEHTNHVSSVAFSPDGSLLASSSADKTVKIWKVEENFSLYHSLERHTDWVRSVAFSPDGSLLASGSDDKTVKIWKVADFSLLHSLKDHTDWVLSVAFSPDGSFLASGSFDNTVNIRSTDSFNNFNSSSKIISGIENYDYYVASLAFHPAGRSLALANKRARRAEGVVSLWGTASGQAVFCPAGCEAVQYASVTINSTAGARLTINGQAIPERGAGVFTTELEAGSYSIRVEKDGYISSSEQLDIVLGQANIFSLPLVPKPPEHPSEPSEIALRIIAPQQGSSANSTSLPLSLALQGQVSDLLFSIDNQSIASNYSRDIGVSDATGAARQVNLQLDLPANLRQGQEFRLSVVASGAAGLSQPVHLDLRYQGPEQAKRELFFVAAGLNSYEDSDIRPLRFAAVDALELAAVFAEQAPQLYDDFYIKVLFTDDNPQHLLQRYLPIAQNNNLGRGDFGERLQVFYNHESTDRRMSGILSRVLREAGPEDTVVIMVSGHGVNIDGLYYIPFYDTDLNAQQSFAETSLQAHDWMTPLSRSNAQVVVFLDTCHSGAARPSNFNFKAATDAELSSPAGFADQLRNIGVQGTVSKSGRLAIITSTSPGELAVENERWQNGALVEAMLEALRDGALSNPQGNPQGDISMLDLISYIDRRVSTLTNNSQTPEYSLGGSNFTLLRLR